MNIRGRENKDERSGDNTLALPEALRDYRFVENIWKELRNLLELNTNLSEKIAFSHIPSQFFCPVSKCLMYDPIKVYYLHKKIVLERETLKFLAAEIQKIKNMPDYRGANAVVIRDYVCAQYPFYEKIADLVLVMIESDLNTFKFQTNVIVLVDFNMRNQIRRLIEEKPKLIEIQYIPFEFIHDMHNACIQGDLTQIRKLINKNYRILFVSDIRTKLLPLYHAVANEVSFTFLIQQLDQLRQGLALTALLHPDERGQLPLEHALRAGESVTLILKIMSWMGRTLDTFKLTGPLPKDRQSFLNCLLLMCVLQGNLKWTEKLISWGADLYAPLSLDTVVLETAIQLADPKVKKALFKNTQVSFPQNTHDRGDLRTRLDQPISVKIVREPQMRKDVSSLVRQLSEFQSIKVILNVLDNHGLSLFTALNKANSPPNEQKKMLSSQKSQSPIRQSVVGETKQETKPQSTNYFELLETLPYGVVDLLEAVSDMNVGLAETILMKNPRLAIESSELLDASLKISAVQYVFCTQDPVMLPMFLKYVQVQDYISQISLINEQTMKAAVDHSILRKEKSYWAQQQMSKQVPKVEQSKQRAQHVPPIKKHRVRKPKSRNTCNSQMNYNISNVHSAFFMRKDISEVTLFWELVSSGSLAQIDDMLRLNNKWAFVLGTMINPLNPHAGNFVNITIYQYALLTHDEAMQKVVLKYLRPEQAISQINRLNESIPSPETKFPMMRRV